jgi:hypothetical protein
MRQPKTHFEDGKYYPIIYLAGGHSYYGRPYKSQSGAYKYAVRETRRHRLGASWGLTASQLGA